MESHPNLSPEEELLQFLRKEALDKTSEVGKKIDELASKSKGGYFVSLMAFLSWVQEMGPSFTAGYLAYKIGLLNEDVHEVLQYYKDATDFASWEKILKSNCQAKDTVYQLKIGNFVLFKFDVTEHCTGNQLPDLETRLAQIDKITKDTNKSLHSATNLLAVAKFLEIIKTVFAVSEAIAAAKKISDRTTVHGEAVKKLETRYDALIKTPKEVFCNPLRAQYHMNEYKFLLDDVNALHTTICKDKEEAEILQSESLRKGVVSGLNTGANIFSLFSLWGMTSEVFKLVYSTSAAVEAYATVRYFQLYTDLNKDIAELNDLIVRAKKMIDGLASHADKNFKI